MDLPHFERNFGGAIFLATWLKDKFPNISTTTRAQISPHFFDCVRQISQKTVDFYLVSELKSISACLDKGENGYKILIPHSFNLCHRRFSLCKELCHVLTDNGQQRAESPTQQLNIARDCSEVIRDAEANIFADELNSEDFCFLLAMEIMLPPSKRDAIISSLIKKYETPYDIAYSLQMPEALISFYEESDYNSFYKLQLKALSSSRSTV